MFYFIDQTSEKEHHMMFNAAMLQIMNKIAPNKKIIYQGIQSSQEKVTSQVNVNLAKNINLESISYTVPKTTSFFSKVNNYIKKEFLRTKELNKILKRTKSHDLILISITTFSTFLIFKILKRKYEVKTIMVLHGDLDFVFNASTILEKFMGLVYKIIFKIKAQNFYYLVLNKIAKNEIVKYGFLKKNEIIEINHPYPFSEQFYNLEKSISTINFGHIGSAEVKRKNSHFLYKIAEKFIDEIESKKLAFLLIGLIDRDMKLHQNNLVEKSIGNNDQTPEYLSREVYEYEINKLHYALFFYDKSQYVFRVSGAVIDAINFEIPIIALKHPYFNYLFELGGNIGYLFDTVEEIITFIKKLDKNQVAFQEELHIQRMNLRLLKQKFKVDYISKDLSSQLDLK